MSVEAEAAVALSVVPSKVRLVPMTTDLIAEVPLPAKIPPSGVDEPVPPPPTPKRPANVFAKVIVLPLAVIVVEAVRPLNAVDEVAKVTAGPVWSAPTGPIEVTALESLLLKVVKSAAVKSPRTVADADGMLKVNAPPELVMPQSLLIAVVDVPNVIAPVCAAPYVCWIDVTPLLIDEVATQVGTPLTSASTWPFTPCEVVASCPEPLPSNIVLACTAAHPVPPFATAKIEAPTSFTRSIVAVAITPAVALRKPVRFARRNVLDTTKFEVEALFETARLVEVAFVDVEFPKILRLPVTVDEAAFTTRPPVVRIMVEVVAD